MFATLAGLRVVVTRPRDLGGDLAVLLEENGAVIFWAESITMRDVELSIEQGLGGLLGHATLVAVPSRTAARRFGEIWLAHGSPALPAIAAVGKTTEAELRLFSLNTRVSAVDESARGLVEAVRASGIPVGLALLPCGNRPRPELREGLEQLGFSVHALRLYETAPKPASLPEEAVSERIDWVLFHSPSAVEGWMGSPASRSIAVAGARHLAIGPTTAAALRTAGLPVDHVCAHPDGPSVVAGLAEGRP